MGDRLRWLDGITDSMDMNSQNMANAKSNKATQRMVGLSLKVSFSVIFVFLFVNY